MKLHKIFQLITAIGESVLAIPFLGGLIVLGSLWTGLVIMLGLHIATLVLCSPVKKANKNGSILGIIASVLGWIPFVGWILHLVSAILLWVSFAKKA